MPVSFLGHIIGQMSANDAVSVGDTHKQCKDHTMPEHSDEDSVGWWMLGGWTPQFACNKPTTSKFRPEQVSKARNGVQPHEAMRNQ
jgi:hypothetical protein